LKHYYVFILLLAIIVSGCSWAGEKAGRTQANIENAVDRTREGYHRGYEEGKNN